LVFATASGLDNAGYLIEWVPGQERRVAEFRSPEALASYVGNPPDATPGRDWLIIRKNLPGGQELAISTEQIELELKRLFPVFDCIALRRPQ
jgi:hypothetical protein